MINRRDFISLLGISGLGLVGARYNEYFLEIDDIAGIGADISEDFLTRMERITI